MHFFFKLSSARREDYKDISEVTGITAEFVKKFRETRWLYMKLVGVLCLKQWENLEYYFLTVLPKQDNFRSSVEKTAI